MGKLWATRSAAASRKLVGHDFDEDRAHRRLASPDRFLAIDEFVAG